MPSCTSGESCLSQDKQNSFKKCIESGASELGGCTDPEQAWVCGAGVCTNVYVKDDTKCKGLYGEGPDGAKWGVSNNRCTSTTCPDGDCSRYGDGFICSNGLCKSRSCLGNKDCPDGFKCDGNSCVTDLGMGNTKMITLIIIMVIIIILIIVGIVFGYKRVKNVNG
jgi:hypothetical protein